MTKLGIERHARWLRLAIPAIVGLLVLLYLLARLDIGLAGVMIVSRSAAGSAAPAWLGDLTVVLLVASMWPLQRMLGKVERGDAFSVAMVRDFRAFAAWLLALGLIRALGPSLFALATAPMADGGQAALTLDVRDLLLLMFTLILFLVARLLERARIAEEAMAEIV